MLFRSKHLVSVLVAVTGLAHAGPLLLSEQGYGDVQFGAKLTDAEARLNQRAEPQTRDADCSFVSFKRYPHILFMVEQGVVTRADAKPKIRNSAGVQVGASLAQVRRLHPGARVDLHKYDPEGHYIVLSSSDDRAALLFEESKGRITAVRAGIKPSVEYVEGCS